MTAGAGRDHVVVTIVQLCNQACDIPHVVLPPFARERSAFGLYGVPESYLIDKDGVIRLHIAGPLTQAAMREQVVPLAEKLEQ